MKTERQRRYALIGGLCGAVYLTLNQTLPTVPEFLMGPALGLGTVFLVLGLLPENAWKTLRKWKRRGE